MGNSVGHIGRHGVRDVDSSTVVSAQDVAVPDVTETTILTHTIAGEAALLDEVTCTGDWRAQIRLYINDSVVETKSISALYPNADFKFDPHRLEVGDKVDVKVLQDSGSSKTYDATIKYHR